MPGAGIYVKRILVKDKERGTGPRGVAAFVERPSRATAPVACGSSSQRQRAARAGLPLSGFEGSILRTRERATMVRGLREGCFRVRLAQRPGVVTC